MNVKGQRTIGLVAVGLFLATLTLLLLPIVPSRAESDAPGAASAGYGPVIVPTIHAAPPDALYDRPELDPAHTTFVIQYQGQAASPELMRELANLKTTGRIAAIDATSAPGRIFVLGEETVVLALRELSGIVTITRADAQPTGESLTALEMSSPSAPPASGEETPDFPSALHWEDAVFSPRPTEENKERQPRRKTFYLTLNPTLPTPKREQLVARLRASDQVSTLTDQGFTLHVTALETARDSLARLPGVIFTSDAPKLHQAGPSRISANGFITGVVTADDGSAPIASVGVYAYDPVLYTSGYDYTDASGVYSISVPAGSYRVEFFPPDYHIAEYYNDVPYDAPGSYTPVVVADGAVTPNINAGLAPGAQIIGRVTDQTTASPLSGIDIYVDSPSGGYYYAWGYTGADGVYTTTPGLPAGSYRLLFTDYNGVYATEYYTHAFRPSLATLVEVTSTNRTGIDATLSAAAVITGTVTNSGPLSDIYVRAYYADEYIYVNSDTTDTSGHYRLAGLGPISHKLRFYDSTGQYLSEWYQDQADWDTADPITPTSGVTTTINAQLAQAGMISGTVTVEGSGTPLSNISVTAYDAVTGNYMNSDSSDASGIYRIGGLAAGSY
ncbi:MAG: carboxypeptidase-like regulatory domain-containing protein [Anaerolineae bacterium]